MFEQILVNGLVLSGGYALVGVLRHTGVVQVVYSDGLHSLSVFEQAGTLDVGRLPRSGEAVSMPLGQGVRYGWPGGQVITWQSGHATFTVVGDGPADDLLAESERHWEGVTAQLTREQLPSGASLREFLR